MADETNPIPGAVSLVIAVTGHRDLHPDDLPSLQSKIEEILRELRQRHAPTPLLLLSGLAEGADRIAVRAAQAASIPYIAVLPMPEDLYRTEFPSEVSTTEFAQLLAGAQRRLTLPLAADTTPGQAAHPGPARDLQYDRLAQFLVDNSQILIAVWDKQRNGKPGGASAVVAMKLGESSHPGRLADSRANSGGVGPVHEILARRLTDAVMPTGDKYRITYPDGAAAADFEAIYQLLDQYNADLARFQVKLAPQAARSRKRLFEGAEPAGLKPSMNWAADVYSWADTLAIHFARQSLRHWNAVFAFLAVAGVALTSIHTLEDGAPVLAAYYLCLALAFVTALWERKKKRRNRHEDYRALAEALRVQFFWMVAGLPDLAADEYLRKQAAVMAWIRDAMSESGLYQETIHQDTLGRARAAGAEGAAARLGLTRRWVEGQANFFLTTGGRHDANRKHFNLFARACAGVGLIAPLAGFLVPYCQACPKPWESWAHAVGGIAMLWAALAWNYTERRGFLQEARQYAEMYDLFHGAAEELKECEREATEVSFVNANGIVRDLGREALAENGDWLAMHRERKLTPGLGAG